MMRKKLVGLVLAAGLVVAMASPALAARANGVCGGVTANGDPCMEDTTH